MASITRESIDLAIMALLQKIPGMSVSRKLKHWDDISIAEMPVIFLSKRGEVVTRMKGLPSKMQTGYNIFIYCGSGDPTVCSSSLLNPVIDAVVDSFEPNGGLSTQQLGMPQSVSHAFISGQIITDEGVLGEKAVAIVPVDVLWV